MAKEGVETGGKEQGQRRKKEESRDRDGGEEKEGRMGVRGGTEEGGNPQQGIFLHAR